ACSRRRGDRVNKREVIMLLCGAAAAWPFAAHAQQPATPVIGFLSVTSASEQAHWMAAFRQGLSEAGYIEGQNVLIEYRRAEGQYNRLAELAGDLVRLCVSVLLPPARPTAFLSVTSASEQAHWMAAF